MSDEYPRQPLQQRRHGEFFLEPVAELRTETQIHIAFRLATRGYDRSDLALHVHLHADGSPPSNA